MPTLDVVKIRSELHEMPELGFEEFKTSDYIAAKLTELGYEVHRGIGGTGVAGYLRSGQPGPTLMLRADMDALPFKNADGSITRIHACGHDGHSAMLLAAAAELVGKVRRGTLKVFFQPAEETLYGAVRCIADGVTDDVDIVLGLHGRPVQDIPAGTMCAAVRHTSSTFINIKLKGRNAHASRPHLGINCAEAAAVVTCAVASIKLDPTKTWSCKVTSINAAAAAHNIIPDAADIWIDARAQTNAVMKELVEKVKAAALNGAAALGATAEVILPPEILPAAEYDESLVAEIADVIREVVGPDKLMPDCGGGGEDFHFYVNKKPSLKVAYFGVGTGCTPGLHDRNMTFDPKYLINGVNVLVKMALRKIG